MTDTTPQAALLPCPFCGSSAERAYKSGSYGYYAGQCSVKCTKCEARSPGYEDEKWEQGKGTYSILEEAEQLATNWWNNRAKLQAATPASEGQLREALSRFVWLAGKHRADLEKVSDEFGLALHLGSNALSQPTAASGEVVGWRCEHFPMLQHRVVTAPNGREYELRDSDIAHPRALMVFAVMLDALTTPPASQPQATPAEPARSCPDACNTVEKCCNFGCQKAEPAQAVELPPLPDQLARDAECIGAFKPNRPTGLRRETMSTTYDQILQRKASALEILGPLGFVDNEDDEEPGVIWHPRSRITLDTKYVNAGDAVEKILETGRNQGKQELRTAMRQALGI